MPYAGRDALVAGHSCAPRAGARAATTESPFRFAVALAGFGHTLQCSRVHGFADPSLAAELDGVRVPVLLADSQARTRPASPSARPRRFASAHGAR